jgi:hypothetical protein
METRAPRVSAQDPVAAPEQGAFYRTQSTLPADLSVVNLNVVLQADTCCFAEKVLPDRCRRRNI